jgi:hypothetical protein
MKKNICTTVIVYIFSICIVSAFSLSRAAAGPLSQDWDLGIGDWYADNGVWEVGTPTAGPESCHSGSQCAGTVLGGNYPFDTSSRLISPTILLPAVSGTDEIYLRFWHWFSYAANSIYVDRGEVQIQEYDEVNLKWPEVFTTISSIVSHTSAGWTVKGVDLTAFASKRVRIAFNHIPHPASVAVSSGWYIDDIEITSPQGIWVVDFDADGDGVPDSSDQCAETPQNACVNNVGCSSTGSYTQTQLDQIVAQILSWGDTDGDGKIGLTEAIRALQTVSGNE